MTDSMPALEAAYGKLAEGNHTSVDQLTKLLQHSKLIDDNPDGVKKAAELFADVPDKNKVDFAKFKEAAQKLADQQGKSLNDILLALLESLTAENRVPALGGTSLTKI